MKKLILLGLLALTILSSCEWIDGHDVTDLEPQPEPVDSLALHNQAIFQMITDSLAVEERMTVVTFMQPDNNYLWNWEPSQISPFDSSLLLVKLIEVVYDDFTQSTIDITITDDSLLVHYVNNVQIIAPGTRGTLITDIALPYEAIDSVLTLVMYRSLEVEDSQYNIQQEVGNDYYYLDYVHEPIKPTLQVYMNNWFWDVVDFKQKVIYP